MNKIIVKQSISNKNINGKNPLAIEKKRKHLTQGDIIQQKKTKSSE